MGRLGPHSGVGQRESTSTQNPEEAPGDPAVFCEHSDMAAECTVWLLGPQHGYWAHGMAAGPTLNPDTCFVPSLNSEALTATSSCHCFLCPTVVSDLQLFFMHLLVEHPSSELLQQPGFLESSR